MDGRPKMTPEFLSNEAQLSAILTEVEAAREVTINTVVQELAKGRTPMDIGVELFENFVEGGVIALAGGMTGLFLQLGIERHAAQVWEEEMSNGDDAGTGSL